MYMCTLVYNIITDSFLTCIIFDGHQKTDKALTFLLFKRGLLFYYRSVLSTTLNSHTLALSRIPALTLTHVLSTTTAAT